MTKPRLPLLYEHLNIVLSSLIVGYLLAIFSMTAKMAWEMWFWKSVAAWKFFVMWIRQTASLSAPMILSMSTPCWLTTFVMVGEPLVVVTSSFSSGVADIAT